MTDKQLDRRIIQVLTKARWPLTRMGIARLIFLVPGGYHVTRQDRERLSRRLAALRDSGDADFGFYPTGWRLAGRPHTWNLKPQGAPA